MLFSSRNQKTAEGKWWTVDRIRRAVRWYGKRLAEGLAVDVG